MTGNFLVFRMLPNVGDYERTDGNNPGASSPGVEQSCFHQLTADSLSLPSRRDFGMDQHKAVPTSLVFEESEAFIELQFKALIPFVVRNA